MIYKNVEIHNISELVDGEEKGSKKWLRVPCNVYENMEANLGKAMCMGATGVELRFVMESDSGIMKMSLYQRLANSRFQQDMQIICY